MLAAQEAVSGSTVEAQDSERTTAQRRWRVPRDRFPRHVAGLEVQRQSHGHQPPRAVGTAQPSGADSPSTELNDPDRLAEQLMRAVVAAERAQSDPRLPVSSRAQIATALPAARQHLAELLRQPREVRSTRDPSASIANVTMPPLALGSTLTLGRGVGTAVAAGTPGRVSEGIPVVGLLLLLLSLGGLYGGGPTVGPLDVAADHAREALTTLAPVAAATTQRSTTAPQTIAVPRTEVERESACPPGARLYDPERSARRVRELFYAVPERFASASRTRWRNAYQLRFPLRAPKQHRCGRDRR
jgi:hypothetical protein